MGLEDYQKREFVRINLSLVVRYKFLSNNEQRKDDTIYKGLTTNISAGGMLLKGQLPGKDWVVDLLMSRVAVGVNILIPNEKEPVKAIARVAWVESLADDGTCDMGLAFKEISRSHQDRLVQLIIQSEMA